ncbi:MAG: hypothetical protein Q8Q28_04455 [Pseudomonadota bacterium]|nr:hypothetical protein [Pseudomonadota bacterium]
MKYALITTIFALTTLPAMSADQPYQHEYLNGGYFEAAEAQAIKLAANNDTSYDKTLYRNGGHFGNANSDVMIEQGERTIAAAPADPRIPESSVAYGNTLYRNGGHFGEANSDVKIEQDRK